MLQLTAELRTEAQRVISGSVDEISTDLFEAICEYASNNGDMPYGTVKARDEDPYEWICKNLHIYSEFIFGQNRS